MFRAFQGCSEWPRIRYPSDLLANAYSTCKSPQSGGDASTISLAPTPRSPERRSTGKGRDLCYKNADVYTGFRLFSRFLLFVCAIIFPQILVFIFNMEKMDSQHQHIEGAKASPQGMESGKQCDFYVEDRVAHLSEEQRQYILAKHGTLDLEPIPDIADADPYNWPRWRVRDHHSYRPFTLLLCF